VVAVAAPAADVPVTVVEDAVTVLFGAGFVVPQLAACAAGMAPGTTRPVSSPGSSSGRDGQDNGPA
jgi:hypothetical protein